MDRARIVHNTLKDLLNSSTKIAFEDGQITTDEANLLEILADKLITIESELLSILELVDDNLDEQEITKRVRLVAREIIPSLTQVAEKDGIITSDEAAILSKVLNDIM
jgi:hypothetical protein